MEYTVPKPCISVTALVTNESGEVLLLRTHWRSDTWEMPGGNVELGEPLDKAICREFLEETGIVIKPIGPRQRSRLLDAMNAKILVPFEAWEANPD